jgi:hypothetical protein
MFVNVCAKLVAGSAPAELPTPVPFWLVVECMRFYVVKANASYSGSFRSSCLSRHCSSTSSAQVGSFFNTVTVSVMLFLSINAPTWEPLIASQNFKWDHRGGVRAVCESGRLTAISTSCLMEAKKGSPQLLTFPFMKLPSVATGIYSPILFDSQVANSFYLSTGSPASRSCWQSLHYTT